MIHFLYACLNFIRRKLQLLLNTSTIGVKALIINEHKEVMLIEHTYMQGWHLPGGGVHPDETPLEAIIREVKEETGIMVNEPPTLFAIYRHKIFGASDYPLLYVVNDFSNGTFTPTSEIKQAKWFPLNNLPKETSESTHARIAEVLKTLPPAPNW